MTKDNQMPDYDETLHKIVMKHCHDKMDMEDCRNMEIEILRSDTIAAKDRALDVALEALQKGVELLRPFQGTGLLGEKALELHDKAIAQIESVRG